MTRVATQQNRENTSDVVRHFTMMYDRGDSTIRKLVDAWYVARDFGEIDMIECQMEQYKEELDRKEQQLTTNCMKTENGYFVWKKADAPQSINKYFKTSEFSCQCKLESCVDQKISVDLIDRLTYLREAKQSPMTITSGFRCKQHQENIRNSGVSTVVAKVSQHELGNAADIKFRALRIEEWIADAKTKFSYIGIATNFLHLDIRPAKVKGEWVTWKY